MNAKHIITIALLLTAGAVKAQSLKGSVVESGSNERMGNVFVRDANTKEVSLTDNKGNFEIKTQPGHLLIFASPGYISDTLYVTDLAPKRVKLLVEGIALREVNISAARTFNPRTEYPDVYRKSKVYVLSPTTWFGREAKNARRLKHYFEREEEERHVDQVFNRTYVSSLVPLRGHDLEDFMTLYRPSYKYIMDNNGPSLAAYVSDSYKRYMALPPEKRKVQALTP